MSKEEYIQPRLFEDEEVGIKPERIRSVMQYYGGKGNMVAKILPLLPEGQVYVEPYFGAGSIFFAKELSPVEVINDIDGEVVNVFRVLQDKGKFEELRHRLMYTPYARGELERAIGIVRSKEGSDVDRAWAKIVVHNFGFGGIEAKSNGRWGRNFVSVNGVSKNVNSWLMRLSMLDAIHWRLMMAQIDNRDGIEVIKYWDSDRSVFYIDPPYILDTRKGSEYSHEMSNEEHERLVELLIGIKGKAVVSGYAHKIYMELDKARWRRYEFNTSCYAAGRVRGSGLQGVGSAMKKVPRVEVVWVKE